MVTVRDTDSESKSEDGIQSIKGVKLPNLITLLLSFLKESFAAAPFLLLQIYNFCTTCTTGAYSASFCII
jgi:hypothetical protein